MMSAANPKIVVGSLNLQGVKNSKNSTRLAQMLAAAKRAKIDVLLAQEHNITEELSADAQILAKRAGFCMALGFCPQGVARVWTAVLVRRTTFGLPDTHVLTHTQHMHGRIVVPAVIINALCFPRVVSYHSWCSKSCKRLRSQEKRTPPK